jgi:hypothetical protein
MSDDPETARQIAELSADPRPLLVLDVDDVLLEFIRPFPQFLTAQGYNLRLDNFRLQGNITHIETGEPAERERIQQLLDDFFTAQAEWQVMTDGAAEALASFRNDAEIVLLTAMPHRHRAARQAHLAALGLPYPVLTTERPKGPAIKALRGRTDRPVAFVDDMPHNLSSVKQAVEDAHLFHLMADNSLRALIPEPEPGIHIVQDWREAAPRIAQALGI